jgi:hypothetical protein
MNETMLKNMSNVEILNVAPFTPLENELHDRLKFMVAYLDRITQQRVVPSNYIDEERHSYG